MKLLTPRVALWLTIILFTLEADMLEPVRSVDGEAMISLPENVLSALGLSPGAQVRLTLIEGGLLVQASGSSDPAAEVVEAFQGVLEQRRSAYQVLAQGADAEP